jgi:transcriptional regulator with XRE-family HTH domain
MHRDHPQVSLNTNCRQCGCEVIPESQYVADQVKARRSAVGLTQKQLAEAAGIHYVSLSNIEGGGIDLSLSTLAALAAALNCTIADLLAPLPSMSKRK